jgi:bifunctional DNA-binding transcriptional regulator/antitoxin component of YhaV-PrlF toxin-antitoxin module
MQQIVSITRQGQLTIPKSFLKKLGINSSTKAIILKKGNVIEVHPKKDFWSLGGSLKSDIKLSNEELRKARDAFSKQWAER